MKTNKPRKVENVNNWLFEEDNEPLIKPNKKEPKSLSYEEVSQLLGWERKINWSEYENLG